MQKIPKPLKGSILKGIAVFAVTLCAFLIVVQYIFLRQTLFSQYRDRIAGILTHARQLIDADDMAECIRTGEKSEKYMITQQALDMMKEQSGVHYLYVVIPLNTGETDNMQNVIAAATAYEYEQEPESLVRLNSLTGGDYSPEAARKYLDAYNAGETTFFENRTVYGNDYTGLLVMRDSEGEKVAALCADFDVGEITGQLRENMLDILIIVLIVGMLFATLFMIWAEKNIVSPIRTLERDVTEFAGKSHRRADPEEVEYHASEIRTGNEVESLAAAIEQMTGDLKEYMRNQVEQEKELARLSTVANRDALTHVGNRNAFDSYVESLQLRMAEGHTEFATVLADTNGLKRINGEYGHEKGDLYLQKACHVICEVYHHSPVFRIGGDKFVAVLMGEDYVNRGVLLREAQTVYRQAASDEKAAPWEQVSVALGMAEYAEGTDRTVQNVLDRAEQQVQEIKERIRVRMAMQSAAEGDRD